jgi:large subunit ribosomal protein L11
MPQSVSTMVEGGKATSGPPLGPALGPLGLNMSQVIKDINEMTKDFKGLQVPVTVVVTDPANKKYEIKVGMPPTSALLKKELGIEKGSGKRKETVAGNITVEQLKRIASTKMEKLLANDLQAAVLEVAGTCISMGITIDGKDPKDFQKLVKSGELKI